MNAPDTAQSATTSQILRAASEHILKKGWCQNEFEDSHGRVCADYALLWVTKGDASRAERYLERVVGGGAIFKWNDLPGRTLEDVFLAFKQAAELAETEGD